MQLEEAMRALEAAGKPQARKVYAKHGVKGACFGVSFATLRAMAKRHGPDQALAEALWATRNHDARVLATLVADPARLSGRVLAAWLDDVDSRPLADLVAEAAARHPGALPLAAGWRAAAEEWHARVGWMVLAKHAEALDEDEARRVVAEIERGIHAAPNQARDAMNTALIAIGARGERLCTLAIEAARRIGKVRVDHGDTACKTPDAEAYILKTVAHRAGHAPAKQATARKAPKAGASGVTARSRRASRSA